MRIGDKCTFARRDSVNCYLDVEIGDSVLVADDVYVSDFDHRYADLTVPIKDQGIVKSPVRIGNDVWLGTKATVVRGVVIGDGAVIDRQFGTTDVLIYFPVERMDPRYKSRFGIAA